MYEYYQIGQIKHKVQNYFSAVVCNTSCQSITMLQQTFYESTSSSSTYSRHTPLYMLMINGHQSNNESIQRKINKLPTVWNDELSIQTHYKLSLIHI